MDKRRLRKGWRGTFSNRRANPLRYLKCKGAAMSAFASRRTSTSCGACTLQGF